MKYIYLVFLLFCNIYCFAQEYVTKLVITTEDNNRTVFPLNEKPVIRFSGDEMIVTTDDSEITFPVELIKKYVYDDGSNAGVDTPYEEESSFIQQKDALVFNLSKNSSLGIYTLSGISLFSKHFPEGGEFKYPVENLQKGFYIITINGLSYKIAIQ